MLGNVMRMPVAGLGKLYNNHNTTKRNIFSPYWQLKRNTYFGNEMFNEHQKRILATYCVDIVTGNRRGAGTDAKVKLSLVGTKGRTQSMRVPGPFKRRGIVQHTIHTPESLGDIVHVHIGHNNKGDLGVGWYLDRVEVHDVENGNTTVCTAKRWLGESDVGSGSGPPFITLSADSQATIIPNGMVVSSCKTGSAAIPHPLKTRKQQLKSVVKKTNGYAGEDAYATHVSPESITLVVADGVHSWRDHGIDAGLFSRLLVTSVVESCMAQESMTSSEEEGTELEPNETPDIIRALQVAEDEVLNAGVKGSCTLCIAKVDFATQMLTCANLGDSGLLVSRNGHVVHRTEELEHSFGYPYQLGHHETADSPQDAEVTMFPVQAGDVLVLGTDGLFDNLAEDWIAQFVWSSLAGETGQSPSAIARELATQALNASYSNEPTPYSAAASAYFNMVYCGGKQDDITVVVAQLH